MYLEAYGRGSNALAVFILTMGLVACGGGGGNAVDGSASAIAGNTGSTNGSSLNPATDPQPTPAGFVLSAVSPTMDFSTKVVELSWPAVMNAQFYKVFEIASGDPQITDSTPVFRTDTNKISLPVALFAKVNAKYAVQACATVDSSTTQCGPLSNFLAVSDKTDALNARGIGYLKASNAVSGSNFGSSVAISADGSTMAVGAPLDPITGGGEPSDAPYGAVYVYTKTGNTWQQSGIIKASDLDQEDRFGSAIALSADGSTLAISSPFEKSLTRTINGFKDDDSVPNIGAVYVYTRQGNTWVNEVYIKGSGLSNMTGMEFGTSLALSSDGHTLAVGAIFESTSINSSNVNLVANRSNSFSGAAFIFDRTNGNWTQSSLIKASNPGNLDKFGTSMALSADGNVLAVGAPGEDGSSISINGPFNDSLANTGAVYVYNRISKIWQSNTVYIKPSQSNANYLFGSSVALSQDGNTLIVGAPGDGFSGLSTATNVNGTSIPGSGAAYIFKQSANTWSQMSYLKAPSPVQGDNFGASVALSSNDSLIAVGSIAEKGKAVGINGNQSDKATVASGAVFLYAKQQSDWVFSAYLKPNNPDDSANFGSSLAFQPDSSTLVIGASAEQGCSRGIVPDHSKISCSNKQVESGAVYLY